MAKRQLTLKKLRLDGKLDGRSTRWEKTPSFTKLYRQGQMGGSIRYRKSKRPFDSKKALHSVLKSELCKKTFVFTNPLAKLKIQEIIKEMAKKCHVTVYKIAIVHNHLHLILHTKRRKSLSRFFRSLSGVLAKRMRKWAKEKNITLPKGESFWSARPYTTLVRFGRQWRHALAYLEKNNLEASGFIAYTKRHHQLRKTIAKIERNLRKFSSA